MGYEIEEIALHETAQKRYLNYAMSVITSRALPDVRDGLKPVQRRILYSMFNDLKLTSDAKPRKSAAIVGDVMGKYHPHGDTAIYDAMVRLAQDFSMRYPLVDGQGNFGSLDGDSAAAMRYTEARLTPLATELLSELKKQTIDYRPNYDGTVFEPVVLPAQLPNLLLNGATGIAVGMATNIPPHHATELLNACIALIDKPELGIDDLVRQHIKGPDFPTGGVLLESQDEIIEVYREGSGTFTIRADWQLEKDGSKNKIIITSIPYTLTRATIVEKIAQHIIKGKLPQIDDVRDESAEDVRIVLELKRGANHEAAMAYLFKHTPLQHRFHTNLTCLIPTDNPQVCAPQRLDLKQCLRYFLDFRFDVVSRRLNFDLDQLLKKIHLLEGLEKIFDALDEALALIRSADGKADAAKKLIARFELDEIQADAVLEKRLYTLARMEIEAIRAELEEKRTAAAAIKLLLDDKSKLWGLVQQELKTLRKNYKDERRTRTDAEVRQFEYDEENYIIDEEVFVIVTRDGWIKRQKSYSDLSAIRVRDTDEVRWTMHGTTRGVALFFTNMGRVYTRRIDDIPLTSGYGEPLQASFDFDDGESVVGVLTNHSLLMEKLAAMPEEDPQLALLAAASAANDDAPHDGHIVVILAVSDKGLAMRTAIDTFLEVSNVRGRLYMKLDDGDTVINVQPCRGDEIVNIASRDGRGLTFMANDVSLFKGAAKGVKGMSLEDDDSVLDFVLTRNEHKGLEVETNRGAHHVVRASDSRFKLSRRANKGGWVIQRGHLIRALRGPIEYRFDEERAQAEAEAEAAALAEAEGDTPQAPAVEQSVDVETPTTQD